MTLLAVTLSLAAAGCGDDDDDPADGARSAEEPVTTAPDSSTPDAAGEDTQPAPEPDPAAGHETLPASPTGGEPQASPGRGCLRGTYVSLSFVGKRSVSSPFGAVDLSGSGRGLALTFARSTWAMRGVGRKPMKGKALGIEGTIKINGSARGRLIRVKGERLRFRQTASRGTVKLSGLDQTFELPVSVVAPAVVPDGRATITCNGDRLTIDSASGVLRLTRR
jgi:hypothetical protein